MNLNGKQVLVTGGTGFLGEHLTRELEKSGARVVPVGSADYDLRRRDQTDRMLHEVHPSAVVHLAATEGGLGANASEPGRFFYENALMGIELIEACRLAGTSKLLISGTVSSYPKLAPVPFIESDLWNGLPDESNAPYALAKKVLLIQAQAYRRQYGMNIICLLPTNVFGPCDNFEMETAPVVPALIRRFVEAAENGAKKVVVWGDGSPTREFLFVTDAALAFRLALERYDREDPVNVGSGEEITIRGLATMIASLTGYRGAIEWDTTKPSGQPRRRLNSGLAKRAFDFEAQVTLEDGLRRTIDWYRQSRVA